MSQDNVEVGGLTANQVTFGEATTLSGVSFIAGKMDGILGLAFDSISVNHVEPVFYTLFRQGQVEDNSFSFYLTQQPGQEGSELILGGVDQKYAASEWKYYDLKAQNYWLIGMDKVAIKDFSYEDNLSAIVDTGTSVIVGPKDMITKMTS